MRLVELVDNDHIPVLVCRPGGSRPVVESGRGGLKSDEESADEQPELGLLPRRDRVAWN